MNFLEILKMVLSNPKKFRYLIFDDLSLGTIDKILPKKFFVCPFRIENFKEIYISKS